MKENANMLQYQLPSPPKKKDLEVSSSNVLYAPAGLTIYLPWERKKRPGIEESVYKSHHQCWASMSCCSHTVFGFEHTFGLPSPILICISSCCHEVWTFWPHMSVCWNAFSVWNIQHTHWRLLSHDFKFNKQHFLTEFRKTLCAQVHIQHLYESVVSTEALKLCLNEFQHQFFTCQMVEFWLLLRLSLDQTYK